LIESGKEVISNFGPTKEQESEHQKTHQEIETNRRPTRTINFSTRNPVGKFPGTTTEA
jgi:hypothetical protein